MQPILPGPRLGLGDRASVEVDNPGVFADLGTVLMFPDS